MNLREKGQKVLANPWRKTETAGRIVQRELQPYVAADLGFSHEGQRPYALADHISPPCWAAVIPQDPTREPDYTPDSPRPRIPKSRNRNYLARSFSVILSSSAILENFFYIVYVIGPEEGSRGRRTPRTFRGYGRRSGLAAKEGLGGPSFSSLFPGLFWIDFHALDPVSWNFTVPVSRYMFFFILLVLETLVCVYRTEETVSHRKSVI
ncbi:hypothetical protein GEV33_009255 [Tenebrio molitor]|uniref:Uncharacterized protein n=1 Tax=Tenebrio molitor TaxID=7067 RepID=A0A8J6HFL9_TENMO|nr:hypothetical protein GEV33_009255 [Tenebrio molitor]